MLAKFTKLPPKYYQLALLNLGLIIALTKGMSLFAILSSIALVAAVIAPIAIAFEFLPPPPY